MLVDKKGEKMSNLKPEPPKSRIINVYDTAKLKYIGENYYQCLCLCKFTKRDLFEKLQKENKDWINCKNCGRERLHLPFLHGLWFRIEKFFGKKIIGNTWLIPKGQYCYTRDKYGEKHRCYYFQERFDFSQTIYYLFHLKDAKKWFIDKGCKSAFCNYEMCRDSMLLDDACKICGEKFDDEEKVEEKDQLKETSNTTKLHLFLKKLYNDTDNQIISWNKVFQNENCIHQELDYHGCKLMFFKDKSYRYLLQIGDSYTITSNDFLELRNLGELLYKEIFEYIDKIIKN